YSVVGDSVNLAARLMAHAEPGEIVATESVVKRSRTLFDTTGLPPFHVKGKAEPVEAVAVGRVRAATTNSEDDQLPLIGRDLEICTINACIERARSGVGQVVDIVADAGMGKSRLTSELRRLADAPRVFVACGDGFTESTPYSIWRPLLHELIDPDGGPAAPFADVLEQTL